MTRRPLLGCLAALLLTAAPAQAATETLNSKRAVDRSCTEGLLGQRAGIASTRFTAPADGTLRAHLTGARRAGDWDLAAYDSAGALIAGSSAFRSNELVDVHLRRGARVTLQACRIGGRGRSVKLRTDFTRVDFGELRQAGSIQLVEVPVSAYWQIEALELLGLDVTHDIHDGHARVMLYGDRDADVLARTGLGYEVVVPDVSAAEARFRAQDRRYTERFGASPLPTGRTEYRTFEDVQQELKDMADRFPDRVRPFTLKTKTYQGRDIQAVEIATDADSDEDTRPVLFLNGIHHAREWPATEVIMEFGWELLTNPTNDPAIARILRDVRVILQPYTNTDGFIVSRGAPQPVDPDSLENVVWSTATGVVLLGGSFGYKRKNCNPYPLADGGQPCEISLGTDNNRNYPHQWGGSGASTNPNDQSYRGSGPGSEPETKAVQELHLTLNAPVLLSMHNIAAKVLRPPGTEAEDFAPDEEALKELGRQMAEPAGYTNEYGWQLYDVTGGTKDWSYAATSSFGYTIETGPANGDFHGAYEDVVINQYLGSGDRVGRGFRESLIKASEWTRNEAQTSRIAGRAPAGRTLRLTKAITTLTSPVCAVAELNPLNLGNNTPGSCVAPGEVIEIPEKLDITTKVPDSGRFTWWVNPSTRPYAPAPEAYKLTCEQDGQVLQETDVVVKRGETFQIDLPCGGTLSEPPGAGGGSATIAIGKVRRAGRRLRVALTAEGGTLRDVRVTVKRGKRTLGRARVAELSGTRTVTVRSRKRLKRGRYTVSVSAAGVDGVRRKVRIR